MILAASPRVICHTLHSRIYSLSATDLSCLCQHRGNKGTIFVLKKADVATDPTAAFAAQIDLNAPPPPLTADIKVNNQLASSAPAAKKVR
jgi:hypothetical protein